MTKNALFRPEAFVLAVVSWYIYQIEILCGEIEVIISSLLKMDGYHEEVYCFAYAAYASSGW